MKLFLRLGLGIFILAILYVGIRFLVQSNTPQTDMPYETVTDFENAWVSVPENVNTITIQGRNGSVTTKNFLDNNETVPDTVNPNNYVLAGTIGYCLGDGTCPQGYQTDTFSVRYNSITHHFTITLLAEPITAARSEMEAFMISRLGLTPAQLCELRATVGVPFFVSATAAGQDIGFTNCSTGNNF